MITFLPPTPPSETPHRKRARFVLRLPEDADRKALVIGLLATLLLHVALIVFLPDKLGSDLSGQYSPEQRSDASRTFSIELAPEAFTQVPVPKKPPTNFVEANPDLPDNEPDNTDNFAAQNQQAAQEKAPDKTGGDRPAMEGEKDLAPTQVVSGNLSPTTPPVPPPPPATPQVPLDQPEIPASTRQQTPLPGIERYVGENTNAFGSNIAKVAPHPEDLKEQVEGAPDAPLIEGVKGVHSSVQQIQLPKERPKLDKRARPAIFAENKIGTSNIGPAAVDARWSNYGQYLQKLIETVQLQWEKLIIDSRTYPTPGSIVHVKFTLNAQGEVSSIVSVEGGMSGQQAERNCVSSITVPAPYGVWTDDMVAVLGEEQQMTFSFYYR